MVTSKCLREIGGSGGALVTLISSFARFKMDKAPQLSLGERLKAHRDVRQKERAVLSSSSQGERYKAAAGSSCATASRQLSTASCLRASKMEPWCVTCPRCPALGAAGGWGSETPLKLAVPSSSLPELGPQTTSRPKIEPAEAGAKEGRGPWTWRLGGEHSGPWDSAGGGLSTRRVPATAESWKCASDISPCQFQRNGLNCHPSRAP